MARTPVPPAAPVDPEVAADALRVAVTLSRSEGITSLKRLRGRLAERGFAADVITAGLALWAEAERATAPRRKAATCPA